MFHPQIYRLVQCHATPRIALQLKGDARVQDAGLLLQFPALFSSYSGLANPIAGVMSSALQEWTLAAAWFLE